MDQFAALSEEIDRLQKEIDILKILVEASKQESWQDGVDVYQEQLWDAQHQLGEAVMKLAHLEKQNE